MATTKTITVTNQTVSVPEFTERPDARVYSDAEGKCVDGINANTQAIAKLDSATNNTNDITVSALSATNTTFFKGSGNAYTGSVPDNALKYATFIVNIIGANKYIIAQDGNGNIWTNCYSNSAWTGWKKLALSSKTEWTHSAEQTGTGSTNYIEFPQSASEMVITVSWAGYTSYVYTIYVSDFSASRHYRSGAYTSASQCGEVVAFVDASTRKVYIETLTNNGSSATCKFFISYR